MKLKIDQRTQDLPKIQLNLILSNMQNHPYCSQNKKDKQDTLQSRAIRNQKESLMRQYYALYLDNPSTHVEFKLEHIDAIFQAKSINLLKPWK